MNPNCGGSYIVSLDYIKTKNAIKKSINPINKKDNTCFRYAVTVVLNHEQIGKYPEIITKIL